MSTFPQRALPSADTIVGTLVSTSPTTGETKRWRIDGTDVLWLGRMLMVEDGPLQRGETQERAYERGRAMVSMILRRLGIYFFSGARSSVTEVIRGTADGKVGWSSPLRYQSGGETSSSGQVRPWSEIPGYFQAAVLDTVTGKVPLNAAHVVDAAEGSTCTRDPLPTNANTDLKCFTEVRIAQNAPSWRREFPGLTRSWLVSTTTSRRWPEENIGIEGGARARSWIGPGKENVALAYMAAGLVGGVYAIWRRLRG